jgi:hypothetical protein
MAAAPSLSRRTAITSENKITSQHSAAQRERKKRKDERAAPSQKSVRRVSSSVNDYCFTTIRDDNLHIFPLSAIPVLSPSPLFADVAATTAVAAASAAAASLPKHPTAICATR